MDDFAQISLLGKAKLDAEVKISKTTSSSEKIHVCDTCASLDISMGLAVEAELKLLMFFKNSLECDIHTTPIAKGHFCMKHDHAESEYPYEYGREGSHFNWADCSRYAYKVTFQAVDQNHLPIANTPITLVRSDAKHIKIFQSQVDTFVYIAADAVVTDSSGQFECYLENGPYLATINGSGIPFTVSGSPTTIQLSGVDAPLPPVEDEEKDLVIHAVPRLAKDKTASIRAMLGSEDVTDSVQWSTEGLGIQVNAAGNGITAKNLGEFTLHASCMVNGTVYTAQYTILVYDILDQGTTGSLTWEIGSDYVLEISGQGDMPNAPWSAYNAKLEGVVVNEGVTSLCHGAFKNAVILKNVSLPQSLKTMTSLAFENCESLEYIFIPKNVSNIQPNVFRGCKALKKIEVDPENPYYKVVDGILYKVSTGELIMAANRDKVMVTIPDEIKTIPDYAFEYNTSMRKLLIPDTLYHIGQYAFQHCTNLESILTYESTSEPWDFTPAGYGYYSFYGCTSLKEAAFPISFTLIDSHAFDGCSSLESITIPDQVYQIGDAVFKDCTSLTEVNMPAQVDESRGTYLGVGSFQGCTDLESIRLPEGKSYIPGDFFNGCTSLYDVNIPQSVTRINRNAFLNCESISDLTLPAGLESIGDYAFHNCSALTELELPEGLETIGSHAFSKSGLVSVVIPDSVKYVASMGFWFAECEDLSDVVFGAGITQIPGLSLYKSGVSSVCIRGLLADRVKQSDFLKCENMSYICYAQSESAWPGVWEDTPGFFENIAIDFECIPDIDPLSITPDDTAPAQEENSAAEEPEETNEAEEAPAQEEDASDAPTQQTPEAEPAVPEETEQQNPENIPEEVPLADSLACTASGSWYHLDLLTGGSVTPEDGGIICVSYTDLVPGRQYLLLMLLDDSAAITPENLLYIDQLAANQDGTLSFRFTPRINGTDAQPQLIGAAASGYPVEGVEAMESYDEFFVDGKPVENLSAGIRGMEGRILTGYRYTSGTAVPETPAAYTQYPISMDVWKLTFREETGAYQAQLIPEMHDLLQYNGCSIRIVGVKGIRMLTSIPLEIRARLLGAGIEGYTLEEYGTVVCWKSDLEANGGVLTIHDSYAKSNYAYSRTNKMDAIFANITDSVTGMPRVQYTNVLVNFTNEQCKNALCMRPYMVLKDAQGQLVTVYGGIVTRSIGYIALQNADVFSQGTPAYDYVHSIISYCYPTV